MITVERIRKFYEYNPVTGIFKGNLKPTKTLTFDNSIYIDENKEAWVNLDGINWKVTHLIWFLRHGKLPETEVLFIDGDKLNFKFENLKEAETYKEEAIQTILEPENSIVENTETSEVSVKKILK